MSKKRRFKVWEFLESDVSYEGEMSSFLPKEVKNWEEAIYYAKKLLKRKDVIRVDITIQKN